MEANEPNDVIIPPNSGIVASQSNSTVVLRLRCKTKEEFVQWKEEYENVNYVTYRVLRGIQCTGSKVLLKKIYRCQHNTVLNYHKVKKHSRKHTNCPNQMAVTIKAVVKESRSADTFLPEYPTVVRITGAHNHRVQSAESLKFRDVGSEVRLKFIDFFKAGNGPSHALELHKRDLQEQYDEDYYQVACDAAHCPSLRWVQHFYNQLFKAEYGDFTKEKILESIISRVEQLKSDGMKITCSTLSDDFSISLCTPIMERVHTLESSGRICFMDSSGNADRYNCRIFLIMTDSSVGGLPLGVLLMSSESEKVLFQALQDYKLLLSDSAFGGRGQLGPVVFLTDDSKAEQNAIKKVFPSASRLLCIFHILQAAWRWLLDSKHGISKLARQESFTKIRTLLYSSSPEEFEELLQNLISSDLSPELQVYIENLCRHREQWALCFRKALPCQGNNTNNITEAAIRVLKDKILLGNRAFSVVQLLQFIVSDLSLYYERKIIHIVSGRYDQYLQSQYKINEKDCKDLIVEKMENGLHKVKSRDSDVCFTVDLQLGLCECYAGRNGGPCKHQHAITLQENICSSNCLPCDSNTKKLLYWVATGNQNIREGWFGSLCMDSPRKVEPQAQHDVSEESSCSNEDSSLAVAETDTVDLATKSTRMLNDIFHDLLIRKQNNETEFSSAIEALHKSYFTLPTESTILSFLHSCAAKGAIF